MGLLDDFPASDPGHKHLDKILREQFGLKTAPFEASVDDNDWTFVVKMQGFVDLAVNQLLTGYFNNSAVSEIICRLDIGHNRRGKLALIRATTQIMLFAVLDLSPDSIEQRRAAWSKPAQSIAN